MAAVVIAQRMPALLVQIARHMRIAANVLAQAMHDHGHASGSLCIWQGPVLGDQAQPVAGADGGGEACRGAHCVEEEGWVAARSQLKPGLVPARGRYSQP